jgi:hypothetical protein
MSACYLSGITVGKNAITVKWQDEKLVTAAAISKLQGEIKQKEFGHRQETALISDQLRKTEERYEKATHDLSVEHAQRLRLSAERANVYASLGEGGSAQCRSLAGYAAQFDGSLEEGRSLVGELKAALGRREAQLRLLGAQITNDRKLMEVR